jgi:hypothetical protein
MRSPLPFAARRRRLAATAAQHRLDVREQDIDMKRLGDVAVGTQLEPEDCVKLAPPRRDKYDWDIAIVAQMAQRLQPIHTGQTNIQKPAKGDEEDRNSEDPVDCLERRFVAVADDGHLDRDPDEQTSPDDEGGGRRKRMSEPDKTSRDERSQTRGSPAATEGVGVFIRETRACPAAWVRDEDLRRRENLLELPLVADGRRCRLRYRGQTFFPGLTPTGRGRSRA